MIVYLNQQAIDCASLVNSVASGGVNVGGAEASYTLLQILQSQNLDQKTGIAVAVNEMVISKKHWASEKLAPNDQILVIQATQGG